MRALLLFAILALLGACHASQPYVDIKGERFYVEIADDPEKQAMGLMFRDHLPPDRGMLFVFRREAPRSFWMKNTRIPLDILYLDAGLRVVSMALDTPPCRARSCPSYPSVRPAQYVLELNAGTASRLGLEPGDRVAVRNVPGVVTPAQAEDG